MWISNWVFNMRKYWMIAVTSWQKALTYRTNTLLEVAGHFTTMVVSVALWQFAFRHTGQQEIGGYTVGELTAYLLIAGWITSSFWFTAQADRIVREIKEGFLSNYLTKPFEFSELIRSINLRLEKHERFVKQSDERFFALIDNPMIGVYIYQENKFIYSNSMITEILGYSKDELKHFSFEDLVCKKEDEELVKIIRCIKGIHGFVHTDVEMYKKNQSITAVEIFGTKIKFKGRNCLMGNMLVVNSKRRELPESKYSKNIKLSRDETLTLQLICKGLTSIEISEKLLISAKAIEARRAKLLLKTDSKNTADLVMFAIRNRFIEL